MQASASAAQLKHWLRANTHHFNSPMTLSESSELAADYFPLPNAHRSQLGWELTGIWDFSVHLCISQLVTAVLCGFLKLKFGCDSHGLALECAQLLHRCSKQNEKLLPRQWSKWLMWYFIECWREVPFGLPQLWRRQPQGFNGLRANQRHVGGADDYWFNTWTGSCGSCGWERELK